MPHRMITNSRKHLHDVNEDYFEHMWFATKFAAKLLKAAGGVLIHAVIPCFCVHTGSHMVMTLSEELPQRVQKCKDKDGDGHTPNV